MTKASSRRLTSRPMLIRIKSRIEFGDKETYAQITFYAWPIDSDDKKIKLARCRIHRGEEILFGDPVEVERKNIVEIRKL